MRRCVSDLGPAGMPLAFPVVWFGGPSLWIANASWGVYCSFIPEGLYIRRNDQITVNASRAWAAMPNALALSVYDWRYYVWNLVFSCTSELVPRAVVFCCIIRCVAQIYSNFKTWQANLSGTKGLNFTGGLTCCDIIWYQGHIYIYIIMYTWHVFDVCSFQKQLPLSQQTFVAFVSQ